MKKFKDIEEKDGWDDNDVGSIIWNAMKIPFYIVRSNKSLKKL